MTLTSPEKIDQCPTPGLRFSDKSQPPPLLAVSDVMIVQVKRSMKLPVLTLEFVSGLRKKVILLLKSFFKYF